MPSLPEFIGPYKVLQELGRGKRTIVYKARQPALEREVALKVLRQNDAETLRRFESEVRLSSSLRSPGVRRIHEAGHTPEGYVYVAMEYVDGSLKEVMRRRFLRHQTFAPEEVVRLLRPIAQALDEIHRQGLVHLDIKPDNILVSRTGQAVLADFGITRRRGETTHEGTPLYLSPEQASGERPIGPWSDIYSLGVLIYEMLLGRAPFVGEQDFVLVRQHLEDAPPAPHTLNPAFPHDLERAVLAALSKDPARRPSSAGELLSQVQSYPSAEGAAPGGVLPALFRRHPYLIGALLILPVIVTLGWLGWRSLLNDGTLTPTSVVVTAMVATSTSEYVATATPTPTRTTTPTPRVMPTSTPIRATPTPELPVTINGEVFPLRLLRPSGELTEQDKMATFEWQGVLSSNQHFVIELEHYDSDAFAWSLIKSDTCITPMYKYDLPKPGNWRWRVRVEPDGAVSDWMEFWLRLYVP
ncbi:MAG: serine/threonine protein kinase [Anaerolineae bacterium]|nr:serine/threonine protein kinase [Anaerolineae bacterium]